MRIQNNCIQLIVVVIVYIVCYTFTDNQLLYEQVTMQWYDK